MVDALGLQYVFPPLLQSLASNYIMSCLFAVINPTIDKYFLPPEVSWPVVICIILLAMIIGAKSIWLLFAHLVSFFI
jgi:hypothetical protein